MNRLLDGIKDRTTREKIAQALAAAQASFAGRREASGRGTDADSAGGR